MPKPKPLDVASWAIRRLKYQDFNSSDQNVFFDAFIASYRIAEKQLTFLYENSPFHHPAQK